MLNLRLPWPPTVNHYYTIARNRKILSKSGRQFQKDAAIILLAQKAPKGMTKRLDVRIDAYPPDNRRRDLDNLLKPSLDALEKYGVFVNDSQIDVLRIRRCQVRKNGELRVHITESE